jgi:Domain of unknown function (DUF3387)
LSTHLLGWCCARIKCSCLRSRVTRDRTIQTAKVIDELILPAKDMREAERRGESLGSTEEEAASYDALDATNRDAMPVSCLGILVTW